ncbi:MAG: uroporphyrinogen decarboxylase family protein, partial [Demequina sp.]
WAGSLSEAAYVEKCAGGSRAALMAVADLGVPRIHFAANAGHLLDPMGAAGATALGVDYRTGLDEASRAVGGRFPLQGNIDPAMLAAPVSTLTAHVQDVLDRGSEAPGHVVNLGHGMPPHADPDVVKRVVELVHERG